MVAAHVKSHPASASGGVVGLATAVAALAGASTSVVAIVGTVAGLLPTAVTLLLANGGFSGVWKLLKDGVKRKAKPKA